MATTSEVIGLLDQVAHEIARNRAALKQAKGVVADRVANLNDIPSRYSDLISTISAAEYGGDAFEDMNKAKLAALTVEFQALVSEATTAQNWLNSNITEF